MKYPMLGEKFCKWFEEEYNDTWGEWFGITIPQEMLVEMELTSSEYLGKYIRPYLDLKKEHLITTLDILVSRLKDRLTPQPTPFSLSYELILNTKTNAIDWLLVHIADLKYFEFNDFVQNKYQKPFNQCIICGKPDFHEREMTKGGKKLKFEFSSKKKYCHVLGCSEDSSNPSEHVDGCHYKEWAYIKKSMNQKLSRCLKRINKLKGKKPIDMYEKEKIDEKLKQIEEEFYEIFENFYKTQYEKNLKIPYNVRAKDCEIFDLREFAS